MKYKNLKTMINFKKGAQVVKHFLQNLDHNLLRIKILFSYLFEKSSSQHDIKSSIFKSLIILVSTLIKNPTCAAKFFEMNISHAILMNKTASYLHIRSQNLTKLNQLRLHNGFLRIILSAMKHGQNIPVKNFRTVH